MKIGIVGYGVVGKHLHKDLDGKCEVLTYDLKGKHNTRDEINECDAVFVCVGTPMGNDGKADLTALYDVFGWLRVPLAMIRSTIPPGTTARIAHSWDGGVVFIPEFIGEGVNPPYVSMKQPPFLIIGGDYIGHAKAYEVLPHLYNSECEFILVDAATAEVAKYAENYFLALKVSWANELYDICDKVGANFPAMMNAVTHDYRIGKSHTHVYKDKRGWSGRCLPKDLNALRARVGADVAPLLDALIKVNARMGGK